VVRLAHQPCKVPELVEGPQGSKEQDLVFGLIERKQKAMLKQEEKVLIRTALMEYRYLLFKTYHGLDDEKTRIAQVNKLLQSWKV
jgi:hypothetical protein